MTYVTWNAIQAKLTMAQQRESKTSTKPLPHNIIMKTAFVFAALFGAASAFTVLPAQQRASALFVTKEEDLELTRKVIAEFQDGAAEEPAKKAEESPEEE